MPQVSNATVTNVVAVSAAVLILALFGSLILAPIWSSYSRLWERLAASFLSLYVLGVLISAGVLGALLIIYFWG